MTNDDKPEVVLQLSPQVGTQPTVKGLYTVNISPYMLLIDGQYGQTYLMDRRDKRSRNVTTLLPRIRAAHAR